MENRVEPIEQEENIVENNKQGTVLALMVVAILLICVTSIRIMLGDLSTMESLPFMGVSVVTVLLSLITLNSNKTV